MISFLEYICIVLPKEMGDLTKLKKLELRGNENLTLPSDSGVWRLTGLEELKLLYLPELKGMISIISFIHGYSHEIISCIYLYSTA